MPQLDGTIEVHRYLLLFIDGDYEWVRANYTVAVNKVVATRRGALPVLDLIDIPVPLGVDPSLSVKRYRDHVMKVRYER